MEITEVQSLKLISTSLGIHHKLTNQTHYVNYEYTLNRAFIFTLTLINYLNTHHIETERVQ